MIESRSHFLRFLARAGRLEALTFLLSHPKERLTINQLARRASISPATAWRATEDLYGLGLICKEPAGRSMLVQLNDASPVVDALAKVEFPDPQLLAYEAFARRLKELMPGATTRLFGSVAKGTARPSSDVDVLVAFEGSGHSKTKLAQACDRAVVEVLDSFRIVISPLLVSRLDVMVH